MSTYLKVNDHKVMRGETNTNYASPCKRLTFTVPYQYEFDIGTTVTGIINQNGVDTTVFYGTVKQVSRRRPENVWEFMAEDIIQRPVEYWFAPENIDEGITWSNISHLALAKSILLYASIANEFVIDDWTPYPTFQFATGPEPVKVQTANAWDVITWINQITGMYVYADNSGNVHLSRIADEPGLVASKTFVGGNSGTIKQIEYTRSDENLRNKVVVYGASGVQAISQAASPYLPANYYKTAIISYSMIDTNEMAAETASINLSRMNKLTETVILEVNGDPSLDARATVQITEPNTGVSGLWFVNQISHRLSSDAPYLCRLTCKK